MVTMPWIRNRELLERIDRHLDRADERWAIIGEEVRLSREQRDRHAEMYADLRQFTRDLMLRMERVTEDYRRVADEQIKGMRDLREESTAQRQALLRVLDRLGPGDSPSAA